MYAMHTGEKWLGEVHTRRWVIYEVEEEAKLTYECAILPSAFSVRSPFGWFYDVVRTRAQRANNNHARTAMVALSDLACKPRGWCVVRTPPLLCPHAARIVKTSTKPARGFLLIRLRHRRIPFFVPPSVVSPATATSLHLPPVFAALLRAWSSPDEVGFEMKKSRKKKSHFAVFINYDLQRCFHPEMIDRVTRVPNVFFLRCLIDD